MVRLETEKIRGQYGLLNEADAGMRRQLEIKFAFSNRKVVKSGRKKAWIEFEDFPFGRSCQYQGR